MEDEARARDLLQVPFAWPLGRRVRRRQRFSLRKTRLVDKLSVKDHFAFFEAHDFQPDRISAWVVSRNAFEQTYARPIKVKSDLDLPDGLHDRIHNDVMPQFTLRNIGRYEMAVDVEGGLPLKRTPGVVAQDYGKEIDEVRNARIPEPEMAQVWTVDYMKRTRRQFRRLLLEDPWELRFGPEATSVHQGLGRNYIVEGTHPDDLPGADWGPKLIPIPREVVQAPQGEVLDDNLRRFDNLVQTLQKPQD